MSLLNALKAIGFDRHELDCVWREAPVDRLERRQSNLKRALRGRYELLVRRRRIIEALKSRSQLGQDHADRLSKMLQRHEDAYRIGLAEVARLQRKLSRCQAQLGAVRWLRV